MGSQENELKKAIKKGNVTAVAEILANGFAVDAELPGKVTALEFALISEQRDIVELLLQNGARPRRQKHDNLLLDVPKFRDLELLRRLVELGADVHTADRNGHTPLLVAVQAGFFDAVRFLLDQGADPLVRTEDQRSAFDLAEHTREFCRVLLKGAEDEVATLFRTQLADLDRIEQLLKSILLPGQVQKLQQKPPPTPETSTSWPLNGDVVFHLEISPFPFTSRKQSRLTGRLTTVVKSWESHFGAGSGQILYRIAGNSGDDAWTRFQFVRREGDFLVFDGIARLPAGPTRVDIRIESDQGIVDGKIQGWEIEVTE